MSDTQTPNDGKTAGVIAKAGGPERGIPSFAPRPADANADGAGGADGKPAPTPPTPGATPAAGAAGAAPVELDETQVREFLKKKGIDGFEKFEDLAKPPATPAAKPEPTPEEKQKAELEIEKRMLERFQQQGGTVETFVELKKLANVADLTQISKQRLISDMKAEKFSDAEIELVLTERYYQLNPDELEKDPGEEDAQFEQRKEQYKRKQAYGQKRLTAYGSPLKQQAESLLKQLRDAVDADELLTQAEVKFSSKVDEFASTLPRKATVTLGEFNNEKLDPVEYEIDESDIKEITELLKDRSKREQFFFNPDNSLNLANAFNLLLAQKALASAAKRSYLSGGSKQVEILKKTFPAVSAFELGIGGNSAAKTGTPGKVVKAGEPERVGTLPRK